MKSIDKNGFTLIELLVVISIVTILAAMLMPVLTKARDKAQQAVCLNRLKQTGLGFLMYANDNRQFVPNQCYPQAWCGPLGENGYVKNTKVFFCPTPKYPGRYGPAGQPRVYGMFDYMEWVGFDPRPPNHGAKFFKINPVKSPSEFLLVADSIKNSTSAPCYGPCQTAMFYNTTVYQWNIHLRHSNRASVLFADGHVGSCGTSKLAQVWEKETGSRVIYAAIDGNLTQITF